MLHNERLGSLGRGYMYLLSVFIFEFVRKCVCFDCQLLYIWSVTASMVYAIPFNSS